MSNVDDLNGSIDMMCMEHMHRYFIHPFSFDVLVVERVFPSFDTYAIR
jgi:hypothetical protein